MATIHIGPDVVTGITVTNTNGLGSSSGTLRIYKGTIIDINNVNSTIGSRSSDLLLSFSVGQPSSSNGSYLDSGTTSARRRQLYGNTSTETAASGSGIASWFAYLVNLGTSVLFIGTVGPTGSSADLQIGTTEIVAGELYTSLGFLIDFPSTYYF